MKANYVLFQGGLGNQLYQLAYTDFLKRNGYSNVKLITPSNKNKGDTKDKNKRPLITQLPEKMGIDCVDFGSKYFYSFLQRLPKFPLYKSFLRRLINVEKEPPYQWAIFHPITREKYRLNIHIGYYQSNLYISDSFKQQVAKVIKSLSPNIKFSITNNDVAIHIRRGDFLIGNNASVFNKIELPHYLQGLTILSERINIQKVYIFSDDFEAIKEDIKTIAENYEVVLVEGQSVLADFALLQKFTNFVIGNSTFAWWGAMLANASNVVVPKKPWKIEMENMSPYPDNWTTI